MPELSAGTENKEVKPGILKTKPKPPELIFPEPGLTFHIPISPVPPGLKRNDKSEHDLDTFSQGLYSMDSWIDARELGHR